MGNIEKPLTWVLVIVLLGYLFIGNCDCNEENSCTANNGFNIEAENEMIDVKQKTGVKIQVEDDSLNVDSIIDAVLEDIDMKGDVDLNEEDESNNDAADNIRVTDRDVITEGGTNEEGTVYTVVDEMPEFSGGMSALMQYIIANVNYPEKAKEENITGKVYTQYIVETDGSISNVNVVRGVDELLDNEAVRVISTLPSYETAGIIDGKKVRVKMTMPINFTL
jgi:protein TonB